MNDWRRLAAPALPAAALLFLVSGPLIGATYDDEEYRSAVIGLMVHARALLDGVYPYWTSTLGFGMPHPLHPAPLTHPLVLLFGLLAPDTAARILYVVHAVVGGVGAWYLVREVGAGRWGAALASTTWMLSSPSANYVLTDFWPVEFITWSLAPYLLLCAMRVLDTPAGQRRWIDAIAFGFVAGVIWANGHAGYVPVFFVPLAVIFVAQWRQLLRLWPMFVLAIALGIAIAGPTLAQLTSELSRFPELPRLTSRTPMGWPEIADMVLRPLTFSANGTRIAFFGGPLLLLAIAFTTGRLGASSYRGRLTLGFLSSLALMLLPALEQRAVVFSGVFLFRDPMVLFGIVLGSLAWDALRRRSPRAATVAAVVQVAALFAAAYPFVSRSFDGRALIDPILHNHTTTAALRPWVPRLPGRWYLAPELEARMLEHRLWGDGLWVNAWPYAELPVVNGTFKGISAEEWYPSEYLAIGQIRGNAATVSAASTLDVLGVSAVLATATEPVAPSLEEVARMPTLDAGDLRLLRNPDAWPGAAFVDESALRRTLEPLHGCSIGGVLCLDLTPIVSGGYEPAAQIDRRDGGIEIGFRTETVAPRWLLVSEMFRPAWGARAGDEDLRVERVASGLIGVQVPAGVQRIELRYRPTGLVLLTWVSRAGILFAVSMLMVAAVNRRSSVSHYLHRTLARYVSYHVPAEARVVEVAPRSPLLIEALARPGSRVVFPLDSDAAGQAQVLTGWDDVRACRPDRIVLNGTVHYERDIQSMLEQLRTVCTAETRIVVAYYSSLWRPALTLGWRLGLTTKGPDLNWVTPSDVANLLRLTGFEVVVESQHVLLPIRIPLISAFVNRWLAPLPVLRWFTLVNLALVRRSPSAWEPAPSVSVVVPARNERGNIAGMVDRIPQMGPNDEIIFVEGHSTDGTFEEMQAAAAQHPERRIRVLKQPGRGKGDAVRAGFDVATGDLLMILDADLTVAPEDLPKFYNALTSGFGEFINGSRLVYPMEREAMRFANMVGNKFFALAFSYLLGQSLKDTLCGTKALSRRHYQQIAQGRLYFGDFDPFGDFDLLFGAAKLGLRFVEMPVRYGERTYGTTNIHRWSHGWLLLRMTAFAARKIKFI